ncbi:MAG: hypothetical protein COU31_02825 [Candidatus Magasanikbacteria bacterium CG10_big_fil_rev_8_21_14_0_10_40_10]|uniref:Uncharacterized protein n=1 Tax=Candidatus Magasanikbacteria bacterium CG10_big_fil_rev_8_21_14_0_10_40_10 TaxID=1974648 RepID=A0A2M6W3W3_9BACT|nr:MAG: hypothetical protein COU31_02825 [Candidatus Magasanikbacteria bacterium CG10_big_fil_rev_8_21_14_0_10_40_10]
MAEFKDAQYWATAPREERPGSFEEFKQEVEAKLGLDFDELPEGTPEEMIGSASLLAFEDWRVVGVGKPNEDPETGKETYTEFKRINMAGK